MAVQPILLYPDRELPSPQQGLLQSLNSQQMKSPVRPGGKIVGGIGQIRQQNTESQHPYHNLLFPSHAAFRQRLPHPHQQIHTCGRKQQDECEHPPPDARADESDSLYGLPRLPDIVAGHKGFVHRIHHIHLYLCLPLMRKDGSAITPQGLKAAFLRGNCGIPDPLMIPAPYLQPVYTGTQGKFFTAVIVAGAIRLHFAGYGFSIHGKYRFLRPEAECPAHQNTQ